MRKLTLTLLFTLLFVIMFSSCAKDQDENLMGIVSGENNSAGDINDLSVSKTLALDVANLFFSEREKTPRIVKSTPSIEEIRNEAGEPLMYIINYAGGGFIIISATKEYYPVLAYSENNAFDVKTELGGIREWVDEVKDNIDTRHLLEDEKIQEIEYLWRQYTISDTAVEPESQTKNASDMLSAFNKRVNELRVMYPGYRCIPLSRCSSSMFAYDGEYIINKLKQEADRNGSPYEYTLVGILSNYNKRKEGPLLTTKWGQGSPYNALCPNRAKAGCVAIAMAQIMKYHKHPSGYNWDNMPDSITATYDTQSLIYGIGLNVQMDYGQGGSGSSLNKAKDAFASKYNYTVSSGDFNYNKVSTEILSFRRPVYMRGCRSQFLLWDYDGHAWVCDGAEENQYATSYFVEYLLGSAPNYYMYNNDYYSHNDQGGCEYSTLYFHMNWGWSGECNGWFSFTSADTNSGDKNFKYGRQDMYIIPKK